MKPTLLILAAGMGSRYGGIKQIDKFGPSGETIIDYSLYDALRAGFGKVVFVIRKEIEADFREALGSKLEGRAETQYVFQETELNYHGLPKIESRSKPWGTAHAVLAAKNAINEPFAVINADDFYGHDAYVQMAQFLTQNTDPKMQSMVGYQLSKTLSENGSVSRGICETDENNFLKTVTERTKIYPSEGKIVAEEASGNLYLDANTPVSMNFWGFKPNVFDIFEEMFIEFVKENYSNPKSEFYIPLAVDRMMNEYGHKVEVLRNSALWFGVTYKEDKEFVSRSLNKLIEAKEYPENLWNE